MKLLNLTDLLNEIFFWRLENEKWFSWPSAEMCLNYGITEGAELLNEVIKANRPNDNRNKKDGFERENYDNELFDLFFMVASARLKMSEELPHNDKIYEPETDGLLSTKKIREFIEQTSDLCDYFSIGNADNLLIEICSSINTLRFQSAMRRKLEKFNKRIEARKMELAQNE